MVEIAQPPALSILIDVPKSPLSQYQATIMSSISSLIPDLTKLAKSIALSESLSDRMADLLLSSRTDHPKGNSEVSQMDEDNLPKNQANPPSTDNSQPRTKFEHSVWPTMNFLRSKTAESVAYGSSFVSKAMKVALSPVQTSQSKVPVKDSLNVPTSPISPIHKRMSSPISLTMASTRIAVQLANQTTSVIASAVNLSGAMATSPIKAILSRSRSTEFTPASISVPKSVKNDYCLLFPESSQTGFSGASPTDLAHIHVYNSGRISEQLSFSFEGCEWSVFYHLGVANFIASSFSSTVRRYSKYLGSSFGSIVAAAMALNLDLTRVNDMLVKVHEITSNKALGNTGVISKLLENALDQLIPNSIDMIEDRLVISTTDLITMTNVQISTFDTKKDLINAIMASCNIPLVHETTRIVDGRVMISGSFTNDLPIADRLTITVSPKGNANISPSQLAAGAVDHKTLFTSGSNDALSWFNTQKTNGILAPQLFA